MVKMIRKGESCYYSFGTFEDKIVDVGVGLISSNGILSKKKNQIYILD